MATLALTTAAILANGRLLELVWTIAPPPADHGQPDWRPGWAAGARVVLNSSIVCEHIQTWSTPYDFALDWEPGTETTALVAGTYYTVFVVRNAAGTVLGSSQLGSFTVSNGAVDSHISGAYGLVMPAGYTVEVYLSAANASILDPLYRYLTGQASTFIHFTGTNPSNANPTYPPAGYSPVLTWTSRWQIPAAGLVQLGQAVTLSVAAGVLADADGNATAAVASQVLSSTVEGSFTNLSLVDSTGFTSDAILSGRSFYVSAALGDDSRTAIQAQSMATPWRTPQKACAVVYSSYNGQGNAVLLRRGDVFTAGFNTSPSGQDAFHPFIIGSYWNDSDGTDPGTRPLFQVSGIAVGTDVGSSAPAAINHVVVRGLDLQCVRVSDGGVGSGGINWGLPGRNIVFEDTISQGFSTGVNVAADGGSSSPTPILTRLMFHRCSILDSYNLVPGQPSAGFNVAAVKSWVNSECLVDRNGYLSSSLITTDQFSHNSHGSSRTYPELWWSGVNRLGGSNGIQFRNGGCSAYVIFSRNANQHFQAGFGGTAATQCVFEKAKDIPQANPSYSALAGTLTFTRGSTIVTGVGTSFTALTPGQGNGASLIRLNGTLSPYPIASVQSDTQLTLLAPFAGLSATGPAQRSSIDLVLRGNNTNINYSGSIGGEGAVYESCLVVNEASASPSPHAIVSQNNTTIPVQTAIVRNVTVIAAGIGLQATATPPGCTQVFDRLILPAPVAGTTNTLVAVPSVVNATADMGSYFASIGGVNDEVAFINMLRARPWRTWAAKYDPANVVRYCFAQFLPISGLAALGTGPWDYYGAVDYRPGGGPPPPPPTLVSIALSPLNPSKAKGTTQQFGATGTYTSGPTQDLTTSVAWASSDTAVATVSAGGLAAALAAGTAQIAAALAGVSASTTLTVPAATLTSIVVTPASPSLAPGSTVQMRAVGIYSDLTTPDLTGSVTWGSGTPSKATISAGGLLTGVAAGTSLVSAVGSVTGSTTATVTAATLSSIAVTPSAGSVPAGRTQQMTAIGTYSSGPPQDLTALVTWSSSNAGFATIDAAGVATGVSLGTTTTKAALGPVSGTAPLVVTAAVPTGLTVTPFTVSLTAGQSQVFTATGTYSNDTSGPISPTWSTDDPSVATVDSTGRLTAVGAGVTTVRAAAPGFPAASASVAIAAASVTSVTVAPAAPTVAATQTQQFAAIAGYSNGTTRDVTGLAFWSTSDPVVAIVSNVFGSDGLATGVAEGSATITATIESVSGSATLTVDPAPSPPAPPDPYTITVLSIGTFDGRVLTFRVAANP